jgi:hypothetical protein
MGEYEMKLMDIDQEHLGIPDTDYDAHITLPSGEFQKIVRDLKEIGESVRIEVTKEGVKFTADGDIGTAAVTLRPTEGGSRIKEDEDEEMESEEGEDEPKPEEDEEEEDTKPDIGSGDEENGDEDGDGKPKAAAKRKAPGSGASKSKKAKTSKGKAKKTEEAESRRVAIALTQSVSLTFSVKYLTNFAKSTPLASEVVLSMSNEVPLLVSSADVICSFEWPPYLKTSFFSSLFRSSTGLGKDTSPTTWRPRFQMTIEGGGDGVDKSCVEEEGGVICFDSYVCPVFFFLLSFLSWGRNVYAREEFPWLPTTTLSPRDYQPVY